MRILIVEDNARMAELLSEGLGKRGFACDTATDLAGADDYMAVTAYEGIILDLGLPDGDGLDWLGTLPPDRPPVLALTGRGALEERITGLDAGADDYLVKPAEVEEIAARLRAILRRPGTRRPTLLSSGALSFDPATRETRLRSSSSVAARRICSNSCCGAPAP